MFVRQLDKRDVHDIFKARRHLEVLALTVNTRISDFHLARMERHLVNACQSAAASEWRNVGACSLRFHQTIVQMLGCTRFNDFFCVLLAQLRLLCRRARFPVTVDCPRSRNTVVAAPARK